MIKYGLLILLAFSVIILGLTSPYSNFPDPRRDPVPSSQKVAHSSHCAGCHGFDETGQALVDSDGNDVNIYDDWQISMMGLSAHDPFFRATLTHEVNQYPAASSIIEETCLKCHAPLGSIQSHLSGLPYSFEKMVTDSLGLDGVSCSSCHQQPSENLGKGHSGNFTLDTNRVMFGPFPNPFVGPMKLYVGFEPVFSDHIYLSGVCAGCHTLITNTLETDGTPTSHFFVEQATYHEWLNSVYPAQGKECQSCHLPFIQDSIVIANDFLVLKKRHPFGLHQFFGANTAMLSLLKTHKEELNLPVPTGPSEQAWDQSIENNRLSLSKAATLEVSPVHIENDTLYFDVTVKNKSGHKLPSGYPNRLTWLQMILTDASINDTIYKNGILDAEGNIEGRDHPYEPHHQVSRSDKDVQIYEMVMGDVDGHLTTRLNAAWLPLKDNRLLPLGFRKNHTVYDTVAIWGEAVDDPQYDVESNKGADIIQYRIPLNGQKGLADLQLSLRYHTMPARWMADLFAHDSSSQIAQFKSMYQGYEDFDEIIAALQVEDIDLSTSDIQDPVASNEFNLFPNPSNGNEVWIKTPAGYSNSIQYKLVDLNGKKIQSGVVSDSIVKLSVLKPGIYFFLFFEKSNFIAIKPYSVL